MEIPRKPSRIDGAGKLVVMLVVDGTTVRTCPIRCPVTAVALSARLRQQGVASQIQPALPIFLETPQIAMAFGLSVLG